MQGSFHFLLHKCEYTTKHRVLKKDYPLNDSRPIVDEAFEILSDNREFVSPATHDSAAANLAGP